MRVLVTGAGGQLGLDLVRCCEAAGDDVIAVDRADARRHRSRRRARRGHRSLRPDAVINCAAWTAVDACEADPDRALADQRARRALARRGLRRAGAHLVQLSTDYVFDGTLDRPYHEWDDAEPAERVRHDASWRGEREALALGASAAVVRTSWVCGEHGANMVKTVLRLAAQHPELAFVDDQIGHPTFTADLAPMLRRLAVDRRSGVHHVTNQTADQLVRVRPRGGRGDGQEPRHGAPDHHGRAAAAAPGAAPGQQRARQRRAADGRPPPAARLPRAARRDRASASAEGGIVRKLTICDRLLASPAMGNRRVRVMWS